MKLAIMQPYFLPYTGYFQLMAAVDKFVVFDDVNYINRGWINRNHLLLNGKAYTFTLPLCHASQNRLICDHELIEDDRWREKLLRTIEQAYLKAPCYASVAPLVERVINYPSRKLEIFLLNSIYEIANYLDLSTNIVKSSRCYSNAEMKGEERILDICKKEGATQYFNAIGGESLYKRANFLANGVGLEFIRSKPFSYSQGNNQFVPCLSILDVLMFNKKNEVRKLLDMVEVL